MRTIIIDDEQNALDVLRLQLENYCSDIEVIACCSGGEDGIKAILEYNPDLVFLDIEMPHFNGFDVLNHTKDLNFKVVFTTAYNQFAIKAFKFSALDYLLKPIDIEELQTAISKAKSTLEKEDLTKKVEQYLSFLKPEPPRTDRIALPDNGMLVFYNENELFRVESDSNYSHFYLVNGKKITLSKTLKEIEEKLSHYPFFRVHQSHIINVTKIKKISKGENAYVVMIDDAIIPISRSKKDSFLEQFRKL